MAFFRDVVYQILDRDWLRYRHLPSFLPRHRARLIYNNFNSGRYKENSGWRRSSAIEMAVTDKHIRAWAAFLDSGADYLICFEDDAMFQNNSELRLVGLLDRLFSRKAGHLVYVDLAGGCTQEALRIEKLQTGQDDDFRHYCKPVTNTACVYLMSRPLVSTFYDILTRRPWLRMIGIDWMVNTLFILTEKAGIHCDCMHADPTIFSHGSVTGEYAPWAR